MKATELMIGDWVGRVFDDKRIDYRQVDWIRTGEIGMRYQKVWAIGCIEPIPLTAEILEKDGWERDIDKEWKYNNPRILSHYCYQWEKQNVKIEMYAGLKGFTISLIIGRRFYAVHELQHVLRLYGLDELADNFKVYEK